MSRKSTYWGPPMSDSQCAVFHFDVKTMSMRDAQGGYLSAGNDAPLIFESLEQARQYCTEKIAITPALGCRIYDHRGQVVQSFSDERVYERHHGQPAAKRNIALGSIFLVAGIGGVALDAWLEWRLTFGVLLGARFLWVGSVKMIDGITSWKEKR